MQLAVDRQQRTISGSAVGPRQGTGEQDPGAQRTATAARLAHPIWPSPATVGNSGRRGSLSRNLLPGRQLDLCGPDRRTRSHGPGAPKARSSHQRYLHLSLGPRCPAAAMQRFLPANKYEMRPNCLDGCQSGTRIFPWRRSVKDELSEDYREAQVFCPRGGFLFESQMQSESAVGVRHKIYWATLDVRPPSVFEWRPTLRSGHEHASLFPAIGLRTRGGMALRPREKCPVRERISCLQANKKPHPFPANGQGTTREISANERLPQGEPKIPSPTGNSGEAERSFPAGSRAAFRDDPEHHRSVATLAPRLCKKCSASSGETCPERSEGRMPLTRKGRGERGGSPCPPPQR